MPLEIREVGRPTDPVHCTVCNKLVLAPEDPDALEPWNPTPTCDHVWGPWHDYGIVYLSPAARSQLAASGILAVHDEDLGLELELSEDPDSEDDRDDMTVLTETIHGPGAVILAIYSGPPTFDGTYVGIAESLTKRQHSKPSPSPAKPRSSQTPQPPSQDHTAYIQP